MYILAVPMESIPGGKLPSEDIWVKLRRRLQRPDRQQELDEEICRDIITIT